MKNTVALCALRPGERGTVTALHIGGAMRRRLRDIGLIEDTTVECLGLGSGGGIAAYFIRGAVIALRREDSGGVEILPI